MNLAELKRQFGRRGVRVQLRSQWNPTIYVSRERLVSRALSRHERKQWGRQLAEAIASENTELLSSVLSDPPDSVTVNDELLESLSDRGYRRCVHDRRYYHEDNMVVVGDGWLAEVNMEASGYFECPTCHSHGMRRRSSVTTVDTHVRYCSNACADRAGCFRTEDGAVYSCEAAAPPQLIYRYNQYFCTALPGSDSYPLGIELEIEFDEEDAKHDFAESVRKMYPRDMAHCKRDGSLSDRGVELVTGWGPFNTLSPMLADITRVAVQMGGKSHQTDTCGQHISVGRSEMSQAQQARFVVFFNHPENQRVLKEFARRTSDRYARVDHRKGTDEFIRYCSDDYDHLLGDKYEAVNCNHPSHLEVRTFKGSLKIQTIMARLSLVRLLAEWCEERRTAAELLFPEFVKYMDQRDCNLCGHVREYMKRRRIHEKFATCSV